VIKQGDEIAQECMSAVRETIEFCESCSEEGWTTITAAEGWPVAAVVRHIAEAGRLLVGFAQEMAAGRDVHTTMEDLDAWNGVQLVTWSKTTRAEAIALLEDVGQLATSSVRAYTEEELAGEHDFAVYGQPRTTARMAQGFALHAFEHLGSARAANEGRK
jgi:DinB superfamily